VTLRYRLLYTAGRLAFHARRATLHPYAPGGGRANWPRCHQPAPPPDRDRHATTTHARPNRLHVSSIIYA
jgi:hypothetical protein